MACRLSCRHRSHGDEGHIVNTASIAGFQVQPGRRSGAYATTKFAVVALSELLALGSRRHADRRLRSGAGGGEHANLSSAEIGRRAPGAGLRSPATIVCRSSSRRSSGLPPDDTVGERVVRAIRQREFFVFTHMETKDWLDERHRRIDACECAGGELSAEPVTQPGSRRLRAGRDESRVGTQERK